ncbi:MAG: response regulator [Acidobacteria bacterium]|nr:response regulator [Acidobacteriota bacterium]
MKVVIIDNEPTILRSLEILIRPKVDSVICFTNPDSALGYIKDYGHTVDILFADYFMPDMNGLELITRSVPFLKPETVKVIISGHIDLIPHMSDKDLPVDHLLSKPFDLDCLLSLLRLPNQIQTYEQQ